MDLLSEAVSDDDDTYDVGVGKPMSELVEGLSIKDLLDGKCATFEVNSDGKQSECDYSFVPKNGQYLNSLTVESLGLDDDEDDSENLQVAPKAPFEKLALKMDSIVADGKVKKRIVREGCGSVIPPGSLVTVHYNSYIEYADEPYDSTHLRGRPLTVRLGNAVITGLDLGLATMKKTEVAQFLVHPDLAYGKLGCPPRIPPEAELLFIVEMINFMDNCAAEAYSAMTPEERQSLQFSQLLKAAQAENLNGNELFKKGATSSAVFKYTKAVRILEDCNVQDKQEEKQQQAQLLKLFLNLAVCYNKMRKPRKACTSAKNALYIDPRNAKALFNFGRAKLMLSDFSSAKHLLLDAQKLEPCNKEISMELINLDKKKRSYETSTKAMVSKMFESSAPVEKEECQKNASLDEFQSVVRKNLLELKNNKDQHILSLPAGLTNEEKQCLRQEASLLGLKCETYKKDGQIQYVIKK